MYAMRHAIPKLRVGGMARCAAADTQQKHILYFLALIRDIQYDEID